MNKKLEEKLQQFCVECGRQTSDLADGLCSECIQRESFIEFPARIELKRCTKCNKIMFQGNFFEESNELIQKIIKSQLKILKGEIESIDFELNEKILVKLSISFTLSRTASIVFL